LPGLQKKQDKHPHPHPSPLKQAKHPSPLLGSTHKSSHSSTHQSSHHSSSSHAPAAVLAKEAISIFGDADGSALFEGKKVLTHTIAEVPPKEKKHSHHSKLSHLSKHSASQKLKDLKHSKESKHESKKSPFAKLVHSHHSSSSASGSSNNPRFKRPLFNFKDVPKPADSVVIRKHHFALKHHALVKKFVNKHSKAQLVVVVDAFVSPLGRRSKKHGDKKKRGHKKSDTNINGILHKNLFVFDDKGKQLYPKDSHSSSSSSSGSKSKNSKLSSSKPALPGLRPVPGQHKKDEKKPKIGHH